MDTANSSVRILFDVMIGQGLKDCVLSPGSRNAPLLIAAAARDELSRHLIPDERTAGFVALGIAIATRKPVMLVCTSGTAMYNYAPAIAEAMYQKIPLIVVTADRPERWIDQDDSQTLRQFRALDNIVKRSFNISATEGADVPTLGNLFANEQDWYVNRLANEAWITAVSDQPGPVHINLQIDNPLTATVERPANTQRIVNVVRNSSNLAPEILREWALHLANRKVLVVAGFMQPDHKLSQALNRFLQLPNVAVCAEPIANLHLPPFSMMVDSILKTKDDQVLAELKPDVVISIGGALVSRMLKEFIRKYQPKELITLSDTDLGIDCMQSLTTHFELSPLNFFRGITSLTGWLRRHGKLPGQPRYADAWLQRREQAFSGIRDFLHTAQWSELKAFDILLGNLPERANLFLSNGTAIRYGALLMQKLPHACYCNRGVSGIDGTNATAAGIAMEYTGPTVLITGDISFVYCPQILGLKGLPSDFKIVVINNSGGGIFRFIKPTRDLDQREEYFCVDTPQPLDRLASAYGWQYMLADSTEKLRHLIPIFYSSGNTLLEIRVEPDTSSQLLLDFFSTTFI